MNALVKETSVEAGAAGPLLALAARASLHPSVDEALAG